VAGVLIVSQRVAPASAENGFLRGYTLGRLLGEGGFCKVRACAWELLTLGFGNAATSKADPRQKQDWVLECLQGGRARPLAACGVATLCCSPAQDCARNRVICYFLPSLPGESRCDWASTRSRVSRWL
jgi:hypothetical protein